MATTRLDATRPSPRRGDDVSDGTRATVALVAAWGAVVVELAAGAIAAWAIRAGAVGGDIVGSYLSALLVALPILGALIVRRATNPIGWVFIALGGTMALAALGGAMVQVDQVRPVPGAGWFLLLNDLGFTSTVLLLPAIFLLFPDGHLPSPRWRWVAWAYAIGCAAVLVDVITGQPTKVAVGNAVYANPAFAGWPTTVHSILVTVGGTLAFAAGIASIGGLVVRYRRSTGEPRAQMKWLVIVAATGAAILMIGFAVQGVLTALGRQSENGNAWLFVFLPVALLIVFGIPASVAIAVFKYRLYDIDVVIRKTVVFGLLAVFITAVYAAIVGIVSQVAGGDSRAGSFLAAAVLAVVFAPVRDRARRIADRLVYGRRATPYEVLAEFSDRVGGAYASDDVLTRMAQVLEEGTGAIGARVLLLVGADLREAASIGERSEDETVVPVTHQGEDLGALAVSMPPSDPMNPAKLQLVEDLASQAGLVLRNVKLIEELKASRQRLVAAQDEERRKIERNIHDGAQQQLVALAVHLKLAEQMVGRDPERERTLLAQLAIQANEALEDLRDLARGIYPPLLADQGLAAALEAQARKAVVPTTVEADGVGRFPQDLESAVYFSCLEALQNVGKYAGASRATIALSNGDGSLRFSVTDDGRGFDASSTSYGTGLQGIADRLAAIGGEVAVTSIPGAGTTIAGTVPTGVAA